MFPVLLLLLIVLDKLASPGSAGSNLRNTLLGAFQQILPQDASALISKTLGQLSAGAVSGIGAVYAGFGSAWGALNGTWAMMAGLNKAYEVKEERPWWKVLSIAFGLTISLGIMGIAALWAMLYGSGAWRRVDRNFGIDTQSPFLGHTLQWVATATLLFFSLALLYRFGPNLNDRRWQWSFPGAVVAVTLWVASTVLLRVYQNHFSSQRIYGGLNAVVALLLWLYFTGAAIFIGGEANSEIEKASAKAHRGDAGVSEDRRSGGDGNPGN